MTNSKEPSLAKNVLLVLITVTVLALTGLVAAQLPSSNASSYPGSHEDVATTKAMNAQNTQNWKAVASYLRGLPAPSEACFASPYAETGRSDTLLFAGDGRTAPAGTTCVQVWTKPATAAPASSTGMPVAYREQGFSNAYEFVSYYMEGAAHPASSLNPDKPASVVAPCPYFQYLNPMNEIVYARLLLAHTKYGASLSQIGIEGVNDSSKLNV